MPISAAHLPAAGIAVVALGEDDAVEGVVELDVHLHARPVALDVQSGDGRHDAKDVADDAELVKKRREKINKGEIW